MTIAPLNSLGAILAILVFVVDLVLIVTGSMPLPIGALIGALAVARLT